MVWKNIQRIYLPHGASTAHSAIGSIHDACRTGGDPADTVALRVDLHRNQMVIECGDLLIMLIEWHLKQFVITVGYSFFPKRTFPFEVDHLLFMVIKSPCPGLWRGRQPFWWFQCFCFNCEWMLLTVDSVEQNLFGIQWLDSIAASSESIDSLWRLFVEDFCVDLSDGLAQWWSITEQGKRKISLPSGHCFEWIVALHWWCYTIKLQVTYWWSARWSLTMATKMISPKSILWY